MNEEEILALPPEARLQKYLEEMQASRLRSEQEKLQAKKTYQEQKKKEKFLKKQKERKFDIDPKSRPQWRLGERSAPKDFSEKSQKFIPAGDLHATELYRASHLIPRSYEYPAKPFKLTKNHPTEFGQTSVDTLTANGKKIIEDNMKRFEEEVERRRQEEMKMKQVEFGPKWECNNTHGDYFSVPPADPYYFFAKDMKGDYLQEKPFLRTCKYGNEFSYP